MRIQSSSDEEASKTPLATPTTARRRLVKKSSIAATSPADLLHTPSRQRKAVVKIPSAQKKNPIVVSSDGGEGEDGDDDSDVGSVIEVESMTSDEYAEGTPLNPARKIRLIPCKFCAEDHVPDDFSTKQLNLYYADNRTEIFCLKVFASLSLKYTENCWECLEL
jgi:hypothetical protein